MTIHLAAELNYGLGFGTDSALFSYTLLMLHVASVSQMNDSCLEERQEMMLWL